MRARRVLLALLIAAPWWPRADARGEDFVSVKVEAEWAQGLSSSKADEVELRVQPKVELPLPHRFKFDASLRARLDALDHLEPGRASQDTRWIPSRYLQAGDRVDLELREFELEGPVGPLWVRLGKQQVVWGTADDLKVLDVVDPQDFRQFILEDFEDSRIPLWTLDAELPLGEDDTLELVWVPDPTFHDPAEPGGTFAFTSPLVVGPAPPPGVPVDVRDVDRPNDPLTDSDAGLRLRGLWKGWDYSLVYLYHYDDRAIPFRRLPVRPGDPIVVQPGYERTHLVGGTFANSFGSLTLRGELGYSTDAYYPTADPRDADGVSSAGELSYVLGLDWYGLSETVFSVQFFHSWLTRDPPGLVRDRNEWNVTAYVRRSLWHERALVSLTWVGGLNRGDGMVRPRVDYEISDDLDVWVGADLFYGDRAGLFGEFDPYDRMVAGIRRTF